MLNEKKVLTQAEMLSMRLDGETYQAIAIKAGVSRQRIQQLLSPPPAIRKYIVERAKGRCEDCGVKVGNSGHVHHVGNNGENYQDIENLQLLCLSCHRLKHTKPLPHAKTERNNMLCDFAREHPELQYKELGQKFNISGPRAWRIIKREGNK